MEWNDLVRAAWELALANRRLAARAPPRIEQEGLGGVSGHTTLTARQVALLSRVTWAIPRAAAVVPWRSDCLRQAEAARRWLVRYGVAAEMRLGARKDAHGSVEAHAWLVFGEAVITGGDISSYRPFS